MANQLSATVLAVAMIAPGIEPVMATSLFDDEEPVNIISPSNLGTNLPGGPAGVSAPVAPQRNIPSNLDLMRAIQLAVEWYPAIAEAIG